MMAKRPADRFASAADVAEALAPYVAGSSQSLPRIMATATWQGSQLSLSPPARIGRHSRLLAAASVAVALLAIVSLGAKHPDAEPASKLLERILKRRLSIVDELEAQAEADLKRARRLRQSILKRVFAGRLVPKNPNDEPAAMLLERIRASRSADKRNGSDVLSARTVARRRGGRKMKAGLQREGNE
jgi:type I restriction enzyme S subunit